MADRAYAWVPIDALRHLVEYADALRAVSVRDAPNIDDSHRVASETVFRQRIDALGVDEMTH
jgi:hypothetical protein